MILATVTATDAPAKLIHDIMATRSWLMHHTNTNLNFFNDWMNSTPSQSPTPPPGPAVPSRWHLAHCVTASPPPARWRDRETYCGCGRQGQTTILNSRPPPPPRPPFTRLLGFYPLFFSSAMCLFFSIPLCPDDVELNVLRCWANNIIWDKRALLCPPTPTPAWWRKSDSLAYKCKSRSNIGEPHSTPKAGSATRTFNSLCPPQ